MPLGGSGGGMVAAWSSKEVHAGFYLWAWGNIAKKRQEEKTGG